MAKESGFSYAANSVWEATGVVASVGVPIVYYLGEPFLTIFRCKGPRFTRVMASVMYEEIYSKNKEKK